MYKLSCYNLVIEISEFKEFLLFNSLSGGLLVLNSNEGELYKKLMKNAVINNYTFKHYNEFINELLEKEFIVKNSINEFEKYKEKYNKFKKSRFYKNNSNLVLTLATTNQCNMNCSYCYEFSKYSSVFSNKNIDYLVKFIESIFKTSPIKKWNKMGVTWYGGEPLLAASVIEKLTPALISLSDIYNIEYSADIITNGILLTKDNWERLKNNRVKHVQVTIDGPRATHDKSRPLKDKHKKNYDTIIENLKNMPNEIKATIRVNIDKNIAMHFSELLNDLEKNGIWPQRYINISIAIALLRTYEQANEKDISCRLKYEEFDDFREKLRIIKFNHFNNWAKKNNINLAKFAWNIPEPQFEECWSIVSPYCFVIDADGYTHKCWENVHDKNTRIQHISKPYNINEYDTWIGYDRFGVNTNCNLCQFLPICSELICGQNIFNNKIYCPDYHNTLPNKLKDQYVFSKMNPDKIGFRKIHI